MNKKIIQRSLDIVYQIFPQLYSQKTKYRTFHFAFAWKKNELLSIGQNLPNFPNSKALKFAKRFKTQKIINLKVHGFASGDLLETYLSCIPCG